MKRLIFILCFLLLIPLIAYPTPTNAIIAPSRLTVDKEEKMLSFSGDDDIRILQLTDIQIDSTSNLLTSFDIIDNAVKLSSPDLIVITGDNMSDNCTYILLSRLVNFIDSFKIPWAIVLGNHDYDTRISPKTQAELFENSNYCLFSTGDIDNSYGNYYFNLYRNGEISCSLLFMDSGLEFTTSHTEWYENTINSITFSNGGTVVPSLVFFHTPTVETFIAYENSLKNDLELNGEINENICYQETQVGFFDKALALGSTTAFIYGHDHVNTLIVEHQGIKLCYGVKSNKSSYYKPDLLGGNLYLIKADNTFTAERIFI